MRSTLQELSHLRENAHNIQFSSVRYNRCGQRLVSPSSVGWKMHVHHAHIYPTVFSNQISFLAKVDIHVVENKLHKYDLC